MNKFLKTSTFGYSIFFPAIGLLSNSKCGGDSIGGTLQVAPLSTEITAAKESGIQEFKDKSREIYNQAEDAKKTEVIHHVIDETIGKEATKHLNDENDQKEKNHLEKRNKVIAEKKILFSLMCKSAEEKNKTLIDDDKYKKDKSELLNDLAKIGISSKNNSLTDFFNKYIVTNNSEKIKLTDSLESKNKELLESIEKNNIKKNT